MGRLDPEARMAIKALAGRGTTRSEIARLLGVTEGAVRHHLRRVAAGAADGRSLQPQRAESRAAAIEHWRLQQGEGGVNLAALHAWLRREHGYEGSLRSVQRYWRRAYPAPAVRARRRVETPAGAQAQVDWARTSPACWWAARRSTWWRCTWCCPGAGGRRLSGRGHGTPCPGRAAIRAASCGWAGCRRRCGWTTSGRRWCGAPGRGARSTRRIGATRRC